MRAGNLDRTIEIGTYQDTPGPDPYTPGTNEWVQVAKVRAQIVQSSTEEFIRAFGEQHKTAIIFRIRFRADVTLLHLVRFGDQQFNIEELKEIGRRRGLELRVTAG